MHIKSADCILVYILVYCMLMHHDIILHFAYWCILCGPMICKMCKTIYTNIQNNKQNQSDACLFCTLPMYTTCRRRCYKLIEDRWPSWWSISLRRCRGFDSCRWRHWGVAVDFATKQSGWQIRATPILYQWPGYIVHIVHNLIAFLYCCVLMNIF